MYEITQNNVLNREEWPVQSSTWDVFQSMPRFCLSFIFYVATSPGNSFLFINTFREAFVMSRLGGRECRDLLLFGVTRVEERQQKLYVLFIPSCFGGRRKVWFNSLKQRSVTEKSWWVGYIVKEFILRPSWIYVGGGIAPDLSIRVLFLLFCEALVTMCWNLI
jgi:hypothetical protein